MRAKRRITLAAKLAISAFVLLCTIEALYWPLLMKPGTVLAWWQVGWLATIDFVVGLPVLVAIAGAGLLSVPNFLLPALPLGLSLLWSTVVYWLLGVALRWWEKKRQAGQHSLHRAPDVPLRG